MLKRIICLFLSFAMVFTMLPFQVFAVEDITEATEMVHETEPVTFAAETQPVETESEIPETTEAAVPETQPMPETRPEETVPAQTVPEETIPVETETEPAAMESEPVEQETEPMETEPEQTIPEETVFYQENVRIPKSVSADAMMASTVTNGSCGENLTWEFIETSGNLTISGSGAMYDYTKDENGVNCPWAGYAVKKVYFDEDVTSVGAYAFYGMEMLEDVYFPETLESIGAHAFENCSELNDPDMYEAITEIGEYAFAGCTSLWDADIPEKVTVVNEGLFSGCTNVDFIDLPDGIVEIGDYAFEGCKEGYLTIPTKVTRLGIRAFADNTYLKEVDIPSGITALGAQVFRNCTDLTAIKFQGDAPVFEKLDGEEPQEQFAGITATVYYPEGNETWTEAVMRQYGGQITWTAYDTVITGDCGAGLTWAFDETSRVLTISGNGAMDNYEDPDGGPSNTPWSNVEKYVQKVVIDSGVSHIGNHTFLNCDNLNSVELPEGLLSIGDGVFWGCRKLTEIDLPDSLTSIGANAFSLSGINEILLPEKLISLGDSAFMGCENLKEITIPAGITEISDYCFQWSGIEKLTIPATIINVGHGALRLNGIDAVIVFEGNAPTISDSAFAYATVTVYYPANDDTWTEELMQQLSEYAALTWIAYPEQDIITSGTCGEHLEWNLTDGVLTISGTGDMADYNSGKAPWYSSYCRNNITSVVVDKGVTSIGNYAFQDISNLTSISLADSVTGIGKHAFSGCVSLTSITLPNSVTDIGNDAFFKCDSLTSITIPGSVVNIGSGAFQHCIGLSSVTIQDGVVSIGNAVFNGCEALTDVTLPDSVKNIGVNAFFGCSSLKNITIPESVTSIGSEMLSNCRSLISITIPESIESIGTRAFYNCNSLTDVYYSGTEERWASVTIGSNNECLTSATFYYAEDDAAEKKCGDNLTWEYDETSKTLTISGSGAMYDFGYGTAPWYRYSGQIEQVVIGEEVTNIGHFAFSDCTSLKEIVLPESIAIIGDSAFSGCSNMEKITFEGSAPMFIANAEGTYSNFSGLGEDTFCYVLFCANDPTWTDEVRQEYGGNITWGYFINYPTECGTGLTWEYDKETSTLTISGNGAMDDFEQYQADIIVPWYDVAADVKTVIVGEGVTNIGDYAFYQFTNMTHAELPDTLTSIGENSFAFCYKLSEVTIPNTVADIGSYAFMGTGLKKLDLPKSVTAIGDAAFLSSYDLTEVTLSDGLTDIPWKAFGGTGLTSIVIPATVSCIDDLAFYDSALQTITFMGDVPTIGSDVFLYTRDTITAYYPVGNATWTDDVMKNYGGTVFWYPFNGNVETSGTCGEDLTWTYDPANAQLTISGTGTMTDYAYRNPAPWNNANYDVQKVVLEEGVTRIGDYAFHSVTDITYRGAYGCGSLAEVSIPDSVTSIGDNAFHGAENLDLTIPANVGSIGYKAVADVGSLEVAAGNANYASASGVLLTKDQSTLISYAAGQSTYVIPGTVTAIAYEAFSGCNALTSVAIPDNVTSLGDGAFLNCGNLSNLSLSGNCPTIPKYAFSGTALQNMTFNGKITALDSYSFANCENLKRVTFDGKAPSLADYVFTGGVVKELYFEGDAPDSIGSNALSGLRATAYYSEENTTWTDALLQQYGGIITWKDVSEVKCGKDLYWVYDADRGRLTISGTGDMNNYTPENPAPWAEYASSIYTVILEDGAASIGDYAFADCVELERVEIAGTVTGIGKAAFSGCPYLWDVTLPEGIAKIGADAFAGCGNLYEITFNGKAPQIDGAIFSDDAALTVYYYADESWTADAMAAFGGSVDWMIKGGACGDLLDWDYNPDRNLLTIAGIGAMTDYSVENRAPWSIYAEKYPSVEIADGVTSIGNRAFADCTSIYLGTLPGTLTRIGSGAFAACSELYGLELPAGITEIGDGAFADCLYLTTVSFAGNAPKVDAPIFSDGMTLTAYYPSGDDTWTETVKSSFGGNVTWLYNGGNCEDGLTWDFDPKGGLLTISGTGDMTDYSAENPAPWMQNAQYINRVTISQGITGIGDYAFADCLELYNVTIADSVTRIGTAAFAGCEYLGNVKLPAGIERIGSDAFMGCTNLSSVTFNGNAVQVDGPIFSEDAELTAYYAASDDTWTEEARTGFGGKVTWCRFNENGEYIEGVCGDNATWFYDEAAATLYINGSGEMNKMGFLIPWNRFRSQIQQVIFAEGITSIGGRGFANHTNLDLTIPANIIYIEDGALTGIKSLSVAEENMYYASADGMLLSGDETVLICYAVEQETYEIPDTVTIIGMNAFADNYELKSIHIPYGVETIGAYAFSNTTLEEVLLPDSVMSMEESVFSGCSNLSSVRLPAGCSVIPDYAFQYTDIRTVIIPAEVTSVGSYAFYGCENLERVTFVGDTPNLTHGSFCDCYNLSNITFLGDAPDSIDSYTFSNVAATAYYPQDNATWTSVINQQYSGTITWQPVVMVTDGSCGSNLIWNFDAGSCTLTISGTGDMNDFSLDNPAPWSIHIAQLQRVVIEEGVTGIGDYAFADCVYAYVDALPSTITRVGESAFYGCMNINVLELPANLAQIGKDALAGCMSLTDVVFTGKAPAVENAVFPAGITFNAYYPADEDTWTEETRAAFGAGAIWLPGSGTCGVNLTWTFAVNGSQLHISGTGDMQSYSLENPAPWSSLGTDVRQLVIDDGVTSVGDYAFYGLTNLGKRFFSSGSGLSLPKTVTKVGQNAFSGCGYLTFITLPAGTTEVGKDAFTDCKKLTKVTFLGDLPLLGETLFSDNMTVSAYYPEKNATWTAEARKAYGGNVSWYRCDAEGILVEGVCGPEATWYFDQETGILTISGRGALNDMSGWRNPRPWSGFITQMKQVVFAEGITNIGKNAFMNAENLDLVLPAHITGIDDNAVMGVKSLTVAPENKYYAAVDGMLLDKEQTTLVSYAVEKDRYSIPNTVTEIAYYAFAGSDSLTEVEIPGNVTSIGHDAFISCMNLTEVVIPDQVAEIGEYAFAGCGNLERVTFEGNTPDLPAEVFGGNGSLTSVKFKGDAPAAIEANAFYDVTATMYYPEDNSTWTESVMQNYGGSLDWQSFVLNVTTKVEDLLTDDSVTSEEIVETFKAMDTQTLKTELENNTTTAQNIQKLEEKLETQVSVAVTGADESVEEVFKDNTEVEIIGAALNASDTASEVKLVIADAPEDVVVNEAYNVENGVVFSMTLEGVDDASQLEIPVRITLPVPSGIDTDKLVILHYHGDDITQLQYTLSENGKTVSFVLDGFSGFAMVEKTSVEVKLQDLELTVDDPMPESFDFTVPEGVNKEDVKLNFAVKDAAGNVVTDTKTAGEYIITATPADADNSYYHITVVDGKLTVVSEKYTVDIAALEAAYDAEVQLWTYAVIPDEMLDEDNAYVEIIKDSAFAGKVTTKVTAAELKEQGKTKYGDYKLSSGMASGEMTKGVTYRFYDGNGNLALITDKGVEVGTEVTYTILDYVDKILEKGTSAQKKIVTALVTYGGYSQTYFASRFSSADLDEENPAYNILSKHGIGVPSLADVSADDIQNVITTTEESAGIKYNGTEGYLDSAIYQRVYFVLNGDKSISDYIFELTYPDVAGNTQKMLLTPVKLGNEYYVDILDIPAAYLDHDYSITVTNTRDNTTYTVTISVLGWIKNALNRFTNEKQLNMLKAMYLYNQAANEFFNK